jgi:hypothetical protein
MKKAILHHLVMLSLFAAAAAAPALGRVIEWKPLDPAHVALKTPKVEKDADAEAIFWEVAVEANSDRTVLSNYIRIKIFTERGSDSQSKVHLPYFGKTKIEEIAARTIRAGGAASELQNDGIFERTFVKAGGIKIQVSSPEANLLDRRIEVTLSSDGSAQARIHERAAGESAVVARREFRQLSRPEYVKMIEAWITRGAPGASVSKVEASEKHGLFALDAEFSCAHYAQLMQA